MNKVTKLNDIKKWAGLGAASNVCRLAAQKLPPEMQDDH